MPNLTLHDLFDEKGEVAGWLILALAVLGRYFDKLEQWPTVSLVALAVVTLLGAQYFRGVEVGPGGFKVSDHDE